MHATWPSYLILLDLTTLVFGEAYKLWSSWLCSLLQTQCSKLCGQTCQSKSQWLQNTSQTNGN